MADATQVSFMAISDGQGFAADLEKMDGVLQS
jgi:hypothetical protein